MDPVHSMGAAHMRGVVCAAKEPRAIPLLQAFGAPTDIRRVRLRRLLFFIENSVIIRDLCFC